MEYAKREILKHGGVNLVYYSWTSVNIKRGKLNLNWMNLKG